MKLGVKKTQKERKINPYWFELIKKTYGVLPSVREFVEINEGMVSAGILWDTLKAFLRSVLIQQVVKYNKDARVWEEKIRREVLEAENILYTLYNKFNTREGNNMVRQTTRV